jgi:DegV family protein with EDD domain
MVLTPMDVATLDGLRLGDTLRAGIYRLFEHTDHINKINVFPVADGDTGTNLSMTLSAVLAALDREPLPHAGRLLLRIADAAIDGARGNSGAIMAQFLLGLGDRAGHLAQLSVDDFAQAVAGGARYARDALTQPREGTLLTVLADFAREAEALAGPGGIRDFRALFDRTIGPVRASLEATRGQLEELRAAGVVDAGAQGFVSMLEGMTRYLATGELGAVAAPVHSGDEAMAVGLAGPADARRYCTECLVSVGDDGTLDLRRLREGLVALGGSIVVSGGKRKARLHIHTDEPERVFDYAAGFGAVSAQKADDMQRQQAAAHHSSTQRVAVVTDSAADIPDDLLEGLGIHVVPMRVHFGNRSWLDKVSLSPDEFYRELVASAEAPKTSQPPPGDFRRMYEFLASHFEAVVSITVTSRASGAHAAATTAAQRVSAEGRPISVIDSLSASLGQGLVAIAAAERARAGGSLAEVEAAARVAVASTRTFALLATVDYAVRGGRVPPIAKTLSDRLGLSIVLATRPDGKVGLGGVLWGRHRLPERFARFAARRAAPSPGPLVETAGAGSRAGARYRVLVGHGNVPEDGRALEQLLLAALPAGSVESSHLTDMGPALGVHGGPGTLIIAIQTLGDPAR